MNAYILGKVKNLMIETTPIASRWYELGCALDISIGEMESLYDKYQHKPNKALARVYCLWLTGKNSLPPTPEIKLIEALRKIKEHTLAATMERDMVRKLDTMHKRCLVKLKSWQIKARWENLFLYQ